MDLEQYASWSNLAMASATVILGLAWLAFVAEWAFTKVGAPRGERVLVGAGAPVHLRALRRAATAATPPPGSASP
jgi:hypothetical protein